MNLPLADAAFEVVFCQQGLQFFADKVSALHETYRVLTPGGRLVWGPIERSLGFAALAEALTRHIGPDASALMTTGPFSLSDADKLRAIIAEHHIHQELKTLLVLVARRVRAPLLGWFGAGQRSRSCGR